MKNTASLTLRQRTCERRFSRACSIAVGLAICALVAWLASGGVVAAAQETAPAPTEAHEGTAHQSGEAPTEEHGDGVLAMLARLVNFAILAGSLYYLLKSPMKGYLANRSEQVRGDLASAAEMRRAAAAEIEAIDRKMRALPAELAAIRDQGGRDVEQEEARVAAAAAAERERLLEQARREIDLQVRVAERDLVAYAADLAVGIASDRIRKNITDEDQQALVDRYVRQLH
jgi:F-type H+-transporting ATPase subunit b